MSKVIFTGRIEPTSVSAAYRAGLLVTAIAMLLLPLLYGTLIVTAAAAVWWHLTANAWILGKGAMQFRLLAYLAPAFAGVVLTFFMVKPILARPARRRDALTVEPEGQPALFALIDEICQQVRAPRPRRVDINCEINAYAGFLRGPFNPFQRDLVLTIGLPLVAGLTARQFAGVIAHEFGHFAQGGGMRLTAIVRGVNGWFTRVVYERDEWDETLERWSKDSGGYVVIAVGLARGSVWLTRRVLLGLMYGGHAISCFMARQMEYDADSYEFKVAGTDAFVGTMVRLRELNMASHFAYNDMREGFHRSSLPADLPVFIVERGGRLPSELLERLRTTSETKTGVFDTHPSDADRIRAAEAAQAPGMIVNADVPATGLFLDFNALSRAATRHHFEHDLGLDVNALTLVDTNAAMRDSQIRADNWNAIGRLFGERWSALRPLHVPMREMESLDTAELLAQMAKARGVMEGDDALSARYRKFESLEETRVKALTAQELLLLGFRAVKVPDSELGGGTSAEVTAADQHAQEQQRAMEQEFYDFEGAARRRLACAALLAIRLTTVAKATVVEKPDSTNGEDVSGLVDALNTLVEVIPDVRELHRFASAFAAVRYNAEESPSPDQAEARSRFLDGASQVRRNKIRGVLTNAPCPPRLAASPVTLAARCGFSEGQGVDDGDEVDRVYKLYMEILGHLSAMTVEVEAADVPAV